MLLLSEGKLRWYTHVRIKCIHEYVQYKEFGGTRPAGKPVCAKCGKVRR